MSEKHEFRAESRQLLDLMINSIYTNREIFLRELISNASDALDKLRFAAVADSSLSIDTGAFEILLTLDKDARTLTITDNGVGMNRDELIQNLGVIAASGTRAYRDGAVTGDADAVGDTSRHSAGAASSEASHSTAGDAPNTAEAAAAGLIGRFGVGFYSAFMVADHVTVISRRYDSSEAFRWDSDGIDGYTVEPADRSGTGTDIILHIRREPDRTDDESEEVYSCYLREYPLYKLVRKYSDYIRYPIKMLMPHPHIVNEAEIEAARAHAGAGADSAAAAVTEASGIPEPIYEEVFEYETLNSMTPLWQRARSEVSAEEYNAFYREHFDDAHDPMAVIPISADGSISYRALLYIPACVPKNYGTPDYSAGLELYSSGVLIVKDCRELIGEEFNFVRGVVDTPDLSLNISREVLQHTQQLRSISANISRKVRSELIRLLTNDREKYLGFYGFFGHHLKVCAMDDYAAKKDSLAGLLMFYSGRERRLVTLDEYVDAMQPDQKYIYYASGSNPAAIDRLPQTEVVRDHGMDILYFMDQADDFVSDMFHDYRSHPFLSVKDGDPELDAGSARVDTAAYRDTFDFIAETLGDEVDEVRASGKLRSHPVCLSSGEGVTFEMERYFKSIHKDAPIHAKRILELNVHHPAFLALENARYTDPERARTYCRILLNQARMIAGLPIDDPGEYTDLVVSLFK